MKSNYEVIYGKIAEYMRKSPIRMSVFRFVYKFLPLGTMFVYPAVLLWCIIKGWSPMEIARIILVPFSGFVAVTLLRKVFNFQRPYTRYAIVPLIIRNKSGESFPSRHTFSIGIIAMACLYVCRPLGLIMWIFTPILALSRVVAGVHFLKDVIGAIVMALLWGIVGFYII